MRIIIDGDSTPDKQEIIETGKKHGIKVTVVLSTAHFSEKLEGSYAETVLVDSRPQEADIKIMNLARPGDAVITNDTPLSYMLQAKGVYVINSRGVIVSGRDMSAGMEALHEEKKMRRSGKRTGIRGPRKYSKDDLIKLIKSIEQVIAKGG
jgi:uncharacterized protein YaiI (UPF0178 family)